MLTTLTPFFFIAITLGLHTTGVSSSKVIKRQQLGNEQLFCIADSVRGRISDDCMTVVVDLANLYGSSEPLLDISTRLSRFPIFCRPSCGRVIINAWQSCGAFNDIEIFANLLTGMCATNANGRTCYNIYNELVRFLNDGIDCTEELLATSTCSDECSDGATDDIQRYGCCVNVVLDFESSLNDQFDEAFFRCGVTRPSRCTSNPLTVPVPPPGSSAASHVASLLPLAAAVCFSAAALM